MRVLFVCVANVARSQMAEAFFNRLSSQHSAQSAGTRVGGYEGQTVQDWAENPAASSSPSRMLAIMKSEEGLDLSGNARKQLTRDMVRDADRVIVLNGNDPYPEYLDGEDKVTFWHIQDVVGGPLDSVRHLKNEIKGWVEELVRELG